MILFIFAVALIAPVTRTTNSSPSPQQHTETVSGYRLLEFGWAGPLQANIAWYANLPLALCIIQMLRGSPPGFNISRITASVVTTALLPFAGYSIFGGWYPGYTRGPAEWLWLACFGVLFATALYARRLRTRPL